MRHDAAVSPPLHLRPVSGAAAGQAAAAAGAGPEEGPKAWARAVVPGHMSHLQEGSQADHKGLLVKLKLCLKHCPPP